MSFINYNSREVNCKIVYYGPGLGGKTTNVRYVYRKTCKSGDKKMISLNNENERTLFFDFLPLELGKVRDFATRFHLYTVPGQIFYEASRKLVLRGVDGVIFVADSQVEKMESNLQSLRGLEADLSDQGYEIADIPLVMQWNKRDLPNVTSVENLQKNLNKWNVPAFEATAVNGDGVFATLKAVSKLVLMNLETGIPSALHKTSIQNCEVNV